MIRQIPRILVRTTKAGAVLGINPCIKIHNVTVQPVRHGPVEKVLERFVVGKVHQRALHHVHDVPLIRQSITLI